MLCRDHDAALLERQAILTQVPAAAVHIVRCDLASLRSVRKAAQAVRGEFDRIAILINNAGIVSTLHRKSADEIGRASCRERV